MKFSDCSYRILICKNVRTVMQISAKVRNQNQKLEKNIINEAQQANDASLGMLSTFSALSIFSTRSLPSTFNNVEVGPPH